MKTIEKAIEEAERKNKRSLKDEEAARKKSDESLRERVDSFDKELDAYISRYEGDVERVQTLDDMKKFLIAEKRTSLGIGGKKSR